MRWLPFQLNPDIPQDGMPRQDYITRKFGGGGNSRYARVAAIGKEVGIDFAFDKITVQPNTVNAHRLMHYATTQGREDAVAEALFKAYFIDGANLTDLASDADCDLVQSADIEARNAGVQGVPFFIFNRKVAVSGAHEAETLLQAMEQALEDQGKL